MRPDEIDREFRRIWWANELWRIPRDAAGAEDREWFEAHPDHTERLREMVPGEGEREASGMCLPSEYYVVRVVRDGFTEYIPIDRFGPEPVVGPSAMFGDAEVISDIDDLPEDVGDARAEPEDPFR